MPRSCSICTHKERGAIDTALVQGQSLRNIAERFGVTTTPLHRHSKDHLPRNLATNAVPLPVAVTTSEAERTGTALESINATQELANLFHRVNLLFNACDAWMRDPDHPEQYTLAPRSDEIDVIYLDYQDRTQSGEPKRKKGRLADLMYEVERAGTKEPERAEMKSADPRELILKTAAQLESQVARLMAMMKDVYGMQEVEVFMEMAMDAIGEVAPDVQRSIADALNSRRLSRAALGPHLGRSSRASGIHSA